MVANRPPIVLNAKVGANGAASITFVSPYPNPITVKQIGITCLTATGAQGGGQGQAYRNSSPISPFFPPDTLGGQPYVNVGPGDAIILNLTAAVVGAILTAGFDYEMAA